MRAIGYMVKNSVSRFRSYLDILKIDKKLLAVCILSFSIPIILTGIYFLYSFAQVIRSNELRQAQTNVDRIENYLTEMLGKAVDIANHVYINTRIHQTVTGEYHTPFEVYAAYSDINLFDDYLRLYNEIAAIRLYVDNPTMLNNSYFIIAEEEIRREAWYQEAKALKGKMFWTYRRDSILRADYISLVREIRNTAGRHIGVLCINMDMGRLERLRAIEPHDTIISLNGAVIRAANRDRAIAAGADTRENWIITNSFIPRQTPDSTFQIIYIIPQKALFAPVFSMIRKSVVIILASLIISLGLILQIINEVYIQKLQKEQLFSRQKEMHLKILSKQINPHFLYNTLETIRMMALEKNEEEISATIKMLSTILRQSLSAGEKTIPLGTELELMRNYLDIQKLRFGSRIDYFVHVEKGAGRCCILPLLIQPLVENSLVHGLETKTGGGYIRINIGIEASTLHVDVSDNGTGMSAERLGYIRETLESTEDRQGERIGLANVNQRIKLYYGDAYGLELSAGPGAGIRVRMCIPAVEHE